MPNNPTVQHALNHNSTATWRVRLGTFLRETVDRFNELLGARQRAMLTNPGLVINAGSSPLAKAGSAFAAVAAGTLVRKPANTAMSALVGTLATAKSALWAFYIDASGTITTSAKTADAATHDAALALMPAVPSNVAMIGFIVVDNASGSNFVGGTTALDAASVTTTYYSCTGEAPWMPATLGTTTIANSTMLDVESRNNG